MSLQRLMSAEASAVQWGLSSWSASCLDGGQMLQESSPLPYYVAHMVALCLLATKRLTAAHCSSACN